MVYSPKLCDRTALTLISDAFSFHNELLEGSGCVRMGAKVNATLRRLKAFSDSEFHVRFWGTFFNNDVKSVAIELKLMIKNREKFAKPIMFVGYIW